MLTKEKIEEIARNMKANNIKPFIIYTQEEANQMNQTSITPYTWAVGDEYYNIDNGKLVGEVKC